jgi:hypothetical protein
MSKLKRGDAITVKGQTYGYFQFYDIVEQIKSSKKARLARVLHSSTDNFSFALIKIVRLIDIKVIQQEKA